MAGPLPGPVGAAAGCAAHRGRPRETRAKEQRMTGSTPGSNRIIGSLRSADGTGVVRMEDRFDTGIDDLWSALTEPARLARWLGDVGGDLHQGGDYRLHFTASGAGGP